MKVLTVFRKEVREAVRDVRTFLSSIMYALAGPLLLVVIVNSVALSMRDDALKPISLCGPGEAPMLVEHLTVAGFEFIEGSGICLNIPKDYARRLEAGRPARLELRADLTTASVTTERLAREIRAYGATLATQRLMARGVSPSVIQPITLDTQNTNTVSRSALFSKLILVILFLSAPFFVSFAMAADITAGERERRSLEALLAQPVEPFQLVLGKFLAVSAVCVFGTAVSIFGGLALLRASALAELGLRVDTSVWAGAQATMLLVPFCLLACALQLAIGLWAKNFKEAQTYLMFLSLLPSLLGMVLAGDLLNAASGWPLAWELGALAQTLMGSSWPGPPFGAMAVLEVALTALLLALCARRLRSEQILARS